MRSSAVLLALALLLGAETSWRQALPGYRYQFPRDHFSHPDFRTEWWYYTGNLQTADGRRFGYELTFFRQGVERGRSTGSVWDVPDAWLAHLALTDVNGRRFHHTERLNRPGPGFAGADATRQEIWNGNWFARWQDGGQTLEAVAPEFRFRLRLRAAKPPVIHGTEGVSRKGALAGQASHYISFTRLETEGEVEVGGRRHAVTGLSWMDHEFFTHQLAGGQVGWDWFSIQLADGSDLMLFRLRRADGSADPFSAGTWVPASGAARPLTRSDFELRPGRTWKGRYPVEWTLRVAPLNLELRVTTPVEDQELTGKAATYWEGLIDLKGTREGKAVQGRGYLEMTGYAARVRL